MGSNASRGRETGEKRRAPRRPIDHLISYTHLDADQNPDVVGIGKTLDVSETGAKIQAHRDFPVGTDFKVVIAVKENLVEAKGRIVHGSRVGKDSYNLGIAFTEIGDKAKQLLS